MKGLSASLLLFIAMPAFAFNDACTQPYKFTTDKRCYVTDQQKQTLPYKAVVRVTTAKQGSCTGTIVRYAGNTYLFTAKHCVIDKADNPVQNMTFTTQDGKRVLTLDEVNASGHFVWDDESTYSTDWAMYDVLNRANLAAVEYSQHLGESASTELNARVIGYGALKIMSDEEITNFKKRYKKWLKDNKLSDKDFKQFGYISVRGVTGALFVDELSNTDPDFYTNIFQDTDNLKVSECIYYSDGRRKYCQGWGGNSGSGIFDSDGNIMGIFTANPWTIGDRFHAGYQTEPGGRSVSLLNEAE